jgi:hypothetical protein
MSALGQKQTFALQQVMSAYPQYWRDHLGRGHETFLNITQTTKPMTITAAAKMIRKVLVSSAMLRPFFQPPV